MDAMIVVDSNVWIFAENETAAEHKIAAKALQKIVGTASLGMNVVIVSEVFHALSRLLGTTDANRRVTNIVEHPSVQWLDFSVPIAKKAMTLSTQTKMRINDALIASQALENKAKVLTDDVKDFRKVKRLRVLPLRARSAV